MGSPSFLQADKTNFSIGTTSIASAKLSTKVSWLTGISNAGGVLELHSIDGKKRKFILVRGQDARVVRDLLQAVLPNIAIE